MEQILSQICLLKHQWKFPFKSNNQKFQKRKVIDHLDLRSNSTIKLQTHPKPRTRENKKQSSDNSHRLKVTVSLPNPQLFLLFSHTFSATKNSLDKFAKKNYTLHPPFLTALLKKGRKKKKKNQQSFTSNKTTARRGLPRNLRAVHGVHRTITSMN
jgi:hypothetical protein